MEIIYFDLFYSTTQVRAQRVFTVCPTHNVLCPQSREAEDEKLPKKHLTGKKWEKPQEEIQKKGSLFQDGQTCNRCRDLSKVQVSAKLHPWVNEWITIQN